MIKTLFAVFVFFVAATVQAISAAPLPVNDPEDIEKIVSRYLESQIRSTPGRKEIVVDLSSPHQKLPPCQHIEPFLPLPATPTGRLTVGIRCIEGASWSVFRTAMVKVYGPAAVAARPLLLGTALTTSDYRMAEIELSQTGSSLISDPAELIDKTLARAIEPGQPIKRDMLRTKLAVTAGDPVRLAYVGAGFTVTAGGKSLGSASEGQRVRVQADNGRILTGTARPNRIIEVYF
jgi:flagellar basal body P-ring formation protein FlgA